MPSYEYTGPAGTVRVTLRLQCAECRRWSENGAKLWRSYLTDDEPPSVEHFCPDCVGRELSDA